MTRCIAVAFSVLLILSACGGATDEAATDGQAGATIEDNAIPIPSAPETSPTGPARRDDPVVESVPAEAAVDNEAAGEPIPTPLPDDAAASAESTDTAGEPELDRWATTPLAEYWGDGYASLADELEGLIEQGRQEQELIAACMAEQGFEYVPWQWSSPEAFRAVSDPGLSADEYREQYGYGISLQVDGPEHDAAIAQPSDPNDEIRAAMRAGERAAYDRALRGERAEDTPVEEQGCEGQANIALYVVERALSEQLGEERRALRDRIDNDPRVVHAGNEWSRCMREEGFFYTSPAEIQSELFEQSAPFRLRSDIYEVLTREEIEAMTDEELEAVRAELTELSPEEQAELDALQEYELAVAAADYECGLPLDDVRYEVTVELEQAFVDEHLPTLEAIVVSR